MLVHRTCRAAWLLAPLLLASSCGWNLDARESPNPETPSADAAVLAPSFSLPADDGVYITSSELLADGRPAVLVFYRGDW